MRLSRNVLEVPAGAELVEAAEVGVRQEDEEASVIEAGEVVEEGSEEEEAEAEASVLGGVVVVGEAAEGLGGAEEADGRNVQIMGYWMAFTVEWIVSNLYSLTGILSDGALGPSINGTSAQKWVISLNHMGALAKHGASVAATLAMTFCRCETCKTKSRHTVSNVFAFSVPLPNCVPILHAHETLQIEVYHILKL